MCFEICRSSSATPQIKNEVCLQKTFSKEALLVVALFLGSGAVLSYFARFGNPLTVGLGLSATGLMTASLLSCKKSPPKNPETKPLNSLSPGIQVACDRYRAATDPLLNDLQKTVDRLGLAIEEDERLKGKIHSVMLDFYRSTEKKSVTECAQALKPMFSGIGDDLGWFQELADFVISRGLFSPLVLAQIFERITAQDPYNLEKNEKVSTLLSKHIAIFTMYDYRDHFITCGASDESNGFMTRRFLFLSRKIFGAYDTCFMQDQKPIPEILARAIGKCAKEFAEERKEDLQRINDRGSIQENTSIGVQIVIAQYYDFSIPASMIAPILPHLKNIPGMIGLELSAIEMPPLENSEDQTLVENTDGFRDEDAAAFLDIIHTNPCLLQTNISFAHMSEKGKGVFLEEWQSILQSRGRDWDKMRLLGHILALPST